MMEPGYVASAIIGGVLRNKREIYIPASGGSIHLFRAYVVYLPLQ